MKIVMLCDLYDDSVQYQENLLAKYYTKHGHDVTVVASTFDSADAYYANAYDKRSVARQYFDARAKIIKLPYQLNLLNKLRRFGGVGEVLEREEPDVIFVHGIHLNLADAAAYKRRHPSCKIIMDYHADYSNSAKNWLSLNILHKQIRRRFFDRHRNAIDRIYPVVPTSALFLTEVYGVHPHDMELLPLGADGDLVDRVVTSHSGTAVRQELAISTDAVAIFTGGRLSPIKQTDCLVDAVLRLDDPALHLVIVGAAATGHEDYVNRLMAKAGTSRRIHFAGWLDSSAVYSYMHACDFAVFPASQSILWQQAIGVGLPIVVGEGSELGHQDPSYLNLYDNVIVLPRRDVRADVVAQTIQSLASNRQLLEQRRAGARRVAHELLNYDAIIQKTLTF